MVFFYYDFEGRKQFWISNGSSKINERDYVGDFPRLVHNCALDRRQKDLVDKRAEVEAEIAGWEELKKDYLKKEHMKLIDQLVGMREKLQQENTKPEELAEILQFRPTEEVTQTLYCIVCDLLTVSI